MLTLLKRWYQRHFTQPGTIEFAVVLIGAFLIVYYLMWLVGPIVVALCIAYCLDWPVEFLEKKARMKRHLASSIVMILFCTVAISITVLIVPQVVKQGVEFYSSIVSFSREASAEARQNNLHKQLQIESADRFLQMHGQDMKYGSLTQNPDAHETPDLLLKSNIPQLQSNILASPTQPALSTTAENSKQQNTLCPPQNASAESNFFPNTTVVDDNNFVLTVTDFDIHIAQQLSDFVLSLPEPIPSMITDKDLERGVRAMRVQATAKIADVMRTQLMPSVVNAFTWLVYLIVVPIFTFLMLYNKKELQKRVRTYILPNNQRLIMHFWPSLNQQIAGYIRGKLIHILIITIANTIAFMALGVNYALLLGVGVGLSVVIPYVGAVIIAVPVVLVAIFQFGFSSTLLWVLIVYTFIQLLDSNVLTPMLFSKAMNLDAFSILSAIMIFGGLWGFWGVFFAIPMATFIKTLFIGWPGTGDEEGSRVKILLPEREEKHDKYKLAHAKRHPASPENKDSTPDTHK